jgi:hypothetical protein
MQLEKRMYFFVPYQLTGIQQAIQAGHAALEYARQYGDDYDFQDFVDKWKTWIILNGGTTNSKRDFNAVSQGSLNQLADQLSLGDGISNGIKMSYFREPDLEDALTAVCFIADERVFNYEDYPEFDDWFCVQEYPEDTEQWKYSYITMDSGTRAVKFPSQYKLWVDFIGGEENVFLRNLLKDKKLA